jgi:type I restriction enzyme, S subunit
MSKEKNNALVPRLRFPEFREDGEWEDLKLSDISIRINQKVNDSMINTFSITAGQGFVSQVSKFGREISGKQYKNYIILKKGEFAYNKGNSKNFPQGCVYMLRESTIAAVPNVFICFRFKNDFIPDFFQGFFDNNYHGKQLAKYITSGARSDGLLNINSLEFFSIKLPTPKNTLEQQKIATTLTTLDELIAAQTEKINALKAHKKGLMQLLFPAEGERVPRLRFPEFQEEGEWEEKRLEELGRFTGGGTPSRSNEIYWKGNIPWVSSSDIPEDSINQYSVTRFISKEALNHSTTKLVPANSILLVSRVGVGKLAVSNIEVCTSQDFTNFTPNSDNLIFLAYILKYFKKTLMGYSQGMAIKGFTKEDISKLNLLLPSIPEQQKIATTLTTIDELINNQLDKTNALQAHKKALMQQLFPNPNDEIQ